MEQLNYNCIPSGGEFNNSFVFFQATVVHLQVMWSRAYEFMLLKPQY